MTKASLDFKKQTNKQKLKLKLKYFALDELTYEQKRWSLIVVLFFLKFS